MSTYIVHGPKGFRVECPTAEAVADLFRVLGAETTPAPVKPDSTRPSRALVAVRRPKTGDMVRAMLEAVKNAGTTGIATADLARTLGLADGRALGGVLVNADHVLGKELREKAIERDGPAGLRRWRAGPRIAEAVAHAEGAPLDEEPAPF